MANTGNVVFLTLEEYYVNGPEAGQATGFTKANSTSDPDYVGPVPDSQVDGISCPTSIQESIYSFNVEGGQSNNTNACTLATSSSGLNDTIYSRSSTLGTGSTIYRTESDALNETQSSNPNGFYAFRDANGTAFSLAVDNNGLITNQFTC